MIKNIVQDAKGQWWALMLKLIMKEQLFVGKMRQDSGAETMHPLIKPHKLCPSWRYHVKRTWNFQAPFRVHWFCRWCPLRQFNGVGRAWRRTVERMEGGMI
jgi:hypothetical protein